MVVSHSQDTVVEQLLEAVEVDETRMSRADAHVAVRGFVDCIAVTLAGNDLPAVKTLRAVTVEEGGGHGVSTLLGTSLRTNALTAALVNGTSAHAMLFDDTNLTMIGHPSSVLVPAILAVAEEVGATGPEVVRAYAAGFEMAVRTGRLLNPSLYEAGWHATSVLGTLGAAVSVARLLELPRRGVRHALGIAVSLASGSRQNFGSPTMALHAGTAARSGVLAGKLAARGFTADDDALTGRYGFVNLFSGAAGGHEDESRSPTDLPLELTRSGLEFKRYPCGAPVQAAVAAALTVRLEEALSPDDIADVECHVSPWNFITLKAAVPRTGTAGRVSLEYCVARALVSGSLVPEHFVGTAVNDPVVQSLMSRIRVIGDGSMNRNASFPAAVLVTTTSGDTYSRRCDSAPGTESKPLSDEDLERKWHECVAGVLPREAAEHALARTWRLPQLGSVNDLTETLCSPDLGRTRR